MIIVLLILFMVMTPLPDKGVPVQLPSASHTDERAKDPKVIVVPCPSIRARTSTDSG